MKLPRAIIPIGMLGATAAGPFVWRALVPAVPVPYEYFFQIGVVGAFMVFVLLQSQEDRKARKEAMAGGLKMVETLTASIAALSRNVAVALDRGIKARPRSKRRS